jgi:hypothetical protein
VSDGHWLYRLPIGWHVTVRLSMFCSSMSSLREYYRGALSVFSTAGFL